MKKFLSLFLLALPFGAYAQTLSERNDFYFLAPSDRNNPSESSRNWINFSVDYHINSSVVTNDFVKALLFKGFVGNTEKDEVSSKLKNTNNRAGYDFNSGFTFKHRLNSGLDIIGGLYYRQQFNASFDRDVFQLVFRGNSSYSGKQAQLSPMKVTFFDYQSLMLGVQKDLNDKLRLGAAVSLIRGGVFNSLKIKQGSLYTDSNGAYVDLNADYDMRFTSRKNFLSSNGLGAGLNLFLTYKTEKGQFNLEVRDLGFIHWRNADTYKGNISYRYQGIEVPDIFNFSDSVFTRTNSDSIAKDAGIVRQTQSVNYLIPATFNVSYMHKLSEKLHMVAGVKYVLNASYVPRVYVKGLYYFSPGFALIPTIAYGGFGKADIEIGAVKSFNSDWIISVNAFYLEYLVLPKKTCGNGFNVSITKLF